MLRNQFKETTKCAAEKLSMGKLRMRVAEKPSLDKLLMRTVYGGNTNV